MKILAIGDPHGNLAKIRRIPKKGIDLILLTGDLGKADLARKKFFKNLERTKKGLAKLEETPKEMKHIHDEIHNSTIHLLRYLTKFAPVYTIQGNVGIPTKREVQKEYEKHGIRLPSTFEEIQKIKNASLVKNRLRILEELRIGFLEYFIDTSWVREFKPSDYREKLARAKKQTEKAKRILERFGSGLKILICHQPPYGILDKVGPPAPKAWHGKHAGSEAVLRYIKKHQPKYVFCGHIHEGEGYKKVGKTEVYNLGVAGHKIIEL